MNFNTEPTQPTHYKSWAERNGFSDWALAVIWLFLCITVFQVLAGLITGLGYLAFNFEKISELQQNGENLFTVISSNVDILFAGNSTWQILFLAIGTLLYARLHIAKTNRFTFLRIQEGPKPFTMTGLTALLVICIQPLIWFLGWLNSFLPVPDFFEQMQSMQMDMIRSFLNSDENILIALFHIGLVPAISEEILFRGYVLRSFEKSWGIGTAIIVSSFIFGLYHLQLTNLLPLSLLGILFAYVTWISRSIFPAIAAHLINNGGSVLLGTYYPDVAFAELTAETMPPLWAVALSLLTSGYLIYYMYHQHQSLVSTEDK